MGQSIVTLVDCLVPSSSPTVYEHHIVCNEELKGGMQGYSLCLLDNQLKFKLQPFGCKRARAQLLRKNYSRNFRSIRSGLKSFQASKKEDNCVGRNI